MIAGLPSSGKSTYIGALWYCLRHPAKNADLKLVADNNNLPEDISVLNKLSDAYKDLRAINRTNSNENERVQLNLRVVQYRRNDSSRSSRFSWRNISRFDRAESIRLIDGMVG